MHLFEDLWNEIVLKRAFPLFVALGLITLVAKVVS